MQSEAEQSPLRTLRGREAERQAASELLLTTFASFQVDTLLNDDFSPGERGRARALGSKVKKL